MRKKELKRRIAELEARVIELEALLMAARWRDPYPYQPPYPADSSTMTITSDENALKWYRENVLKWFRLPSTTSGQ